MPKNVTLELKCAFCGASLMDPSHKVEGYPGIKLIAKTGDDTGPVWLSCIFGSPKVDTDMEFPQKSVAHFSCPHCSADCSTELKCDMCGAEMAMFKLSDGGQVRVCCRTRCKNVWLDL